MAKPKKITQINGKEENFAPSTLDQVWGDKGMTKYGTLKLDEYIKEIQSMNLSDLQLHARKVGVQPSDNRDLIVRKLVKEFNAYVGLYKMPAKQTNNGKSISTSALKILGEGK